MDSEISLESLRLPPSAGTNGPAVPLKTPPRHKQGHHFVKGPIPWNWISKAGQLPGKALHVGVCIWYLAGLNRSRMIHLSMARLSELGVSRYAGYRGLNSLELTGLVRVVRHKGRLSTVELLDCV
jgi:hypothetical protein